MDKVTLVLSQASAGYRVTFFQDHYGGHSVQLSRGWLWPRRHIKLNDDEFVRIKSALKSSRPQRVARESRDEPGRQAVRG